jgi:prefoldin subunit 5
MKKQLGCLILGLALFFSVQPAFSQTSEEFQALKKEVEGLKKEVQDLRKEVRSRPAAPGEFREAIINIKGAPIKGDKKAKLVLLEFSDYQ